MRGLWVLFAMSLPASAQDIAVPSGQPVSFVELIQDDDGAEAGTWRFRFLAPEIARAGGTVALDVALDDMQAVCDVFVAPALARRNVTPRQIIISFADRAVEFGTTSPDATQFFEAFSLNGDACVWEGF